jgi:hypothetical protein
VIAGPTFLTCLLACGAVALLPECAAPGEVGAPLTLTSARVPDDAVKPSPPSIKIEWERVTDSKSRNGSVNVSGVDAAMLSVLESSRMSASRWSSFFAVRVAVAGDAKPGSEEAPPLWGSYEIDQKLIRFVPRFPPEPGIRYRAVFDPVRLRSLVKELAPTVVLADPKAAESRLTADLFFTKRELRPTTKVAAVYPSGEGLPENLLRFYIHFSAPMSRGEAYRHLKLIDIATGKPVHSPFLELEEELWSPDGMRFTLFIDPGRIKRGLKPRELFGPVLEAGKSYCLVVDRGWIDAAGNVLQSEYRRTFRAGPPDESMPDPKKWSLSPPGAATRDALIVRFPEPLDRALLERLVGVRDSDGRAVSGAVSIAEAETLWRFVPEDPWLAGTYRLVVGSELEDVAGNSVASPFEVDMTTAITKRVSSERVELPFSVGVGRRTR